MDKSSVSQGTYSNLAGKAFAQEIAALFHARRLGATPQKQTHMDSVLGRNVVLTVYAEPCKVFPCGLGIKGTRQITPGSGADQVVKDYLDIVCTWGIPGVLILEGNNRDIDPARDFAQSRALDKYLNPETTKPGNFLGAFTFAEFEKWLDCCLTEGKPVDVAPKTRMIDLISQISLFDS